jgi:hypothetical protein
MFCDGDKVRIGSGFTVIVTEAEELQPVVFVPVTVYVVVTPGFAIAAEPEVVLRLVSGSHE